jgi:hypothetical protein
LMNDVTLMNFMDTSKKRMIEYNQDES